MTPQRSGMLCPLCHMDLRVTDRQGIEVDYCPQCRGVWLDRGELDKILERSMLPARMEEDRRYRDDDDDDYRSDPRSRRKRRGFLGDLFDFD